MVVFEGLADYDVTVEASPRCFVGPARTLNSVEQSNSLFDRVGI